MEGILPSGKTDPGIVREIILKRSIPVSSDEFPTSLSVVLESDLEFLHLEVKNTSHYKVLPGIVNLLDGLSERSDVLVGLATGNVEPGARIKLERGNLNRYFSFGGYGSDAENRTQLVRRAAEMGAAVAAVRWGRLPDPSEVFVIGDTPLDIQAGREAGFPTIGVATGVFTRFELAEAGATIALPDLEQGRDQFLRTTRIE